MHNWFFESLFITAFESLSSIKTWLQLKLSFQINNMNNMNKMKNMNKIIIYSKK